MSKKLHLRIIDHIADRSYEPKKPRALAREMRIHDGEYGEFRDAIKALQSAGRIVLGSGQAILLPEAGKYVVGKYRANPRGFGFIVPDSPLAHGDLFVPEGNASDAITGDTVKARVLRRGKRDGKTLFRARIEEVLERGNSRFVGELCSDRGKWFVQPDGNTLHVPVFVPDAPAARARPGDQVVVEILSYPGARTRATGVIVEVLGRRGEPGVDLASIIREYQLPHEFGDEVLRDARQIVREFDPQNENKKRLDLRRRTIVTIDPNDAKDFDDAISLRKLPGGQCELGIHIADVARFVPERSLIDDEARKRGNSVYFPGRVLPMLPELLSNGLCSLQEGQDRLTRTVFIRYDDQGRALQTHFANSVIRSASRLTYQQASLIIDGKTGGFETPVVELVRRMGKLARLIQSRRLSAGALTLDMPEMELVLDDAGRVVDAVPADDSYSHTVIEMFMVEANEAVARLLDGLGVPILRRIHPDPEPASLANLAKYLRLIGQEVPKDPSRNDLQLVLDRVRGTPASLAVNLAVLRSLQQATYSPEPIGHFALASEHYAHFTSPIRRYPDLIVHRMLDRYLHGELKPKQKSTKQFETEYERLAELGRHCSYTERRAADAERDLKFVKVLELLAGRIGDECRGVVTGVTHFGVFVQIQGLPVEGLIRLQDLPDDSWQLDARAGCLIGQRTGKRFGIGDLLTVQLLAANVSARRLDLCLVARHARDSNAPVVAPRRDAKPSTAPSLRSARAKKRSQTVRPRSATRKRTPHRKRRAR